MHETRIQDSIAIISSQAFSLVNFRAPLISKLVASGLRVYALAPDYDMKVRDQVGALGAVPLDFPLARTGMNPMHDFLSVFRLAILLHRLRPDIVFCYFIKPIIFGTTAAWLAGVPRRVVLLAGLGYVFTPPKGRLSLKRRLLKTTVSWMYRFALGRAHTVIFHNPDDLDEFVNKSLVYNNKTVNAGGTGIDLDEWPLLPPVYSPTTFLLAARLLREKGIVEFAEAARQIKALQPETRCILLGGLDSNPGGLRAETVRQWVEEGILEWPGHVRVQPWLARTSVFVLPSYREGAPRSTQEAMASGRPVITTDVPGCRETVVEGKNGYLIPPYNSDALVQTMRRFFEQPDLIRTMGLASRALAEERFDIKKINENMIEWLLHGIKK